MKRFITAAFLLTSAAIAHEPVAPVSAEILVHVPADILVALVHYSDRTELVVETSESADSCYTQFVLDINYCDEDLEYCLAMDPDREFCMDNFEACRASARYVFDHCE